MVADIVNTINLTPNQSSNNYKASIEDTKSKSRSFIKILKDTEEKYSSFKLEDEEGKTYESQVVNTDEQVICKISPLVKENNEVLTEDIESESFKKDEEDLIELLDLIFSISGADINKTRLMNLINNSDEEGLKNAFSKIISEAVLKSDVSAGQVLLPKVEYMVDTENFGGELIKRLDSIADKITDKIATDVNFKELIINKLSSEHKDITDYKVHNLKEALISRIYALGDNKTEDNSNGVDFLNLFSKKDSQKENIALVNDDSISEILKEDDKSIEIKSDILSEEKVEGFLKNLLEDKGKESKENSIESRISNVVIRMENFKGEKTLSVDEKPVISKNSFNADFIKAVKYMDINNVKELTVKIIPKELGEIVIKLTMDNGVIKGNIAAHNKETFEILNSQLPAINNELVKQNVNIQNFSLSLYNGDNFLFNGNEGFKGNEQNFHRRGAHSEIQEMDETVSEDNSFKDNSVNILA